MILRFCLGPVIGYWTTKTYYSNINLGRSISENLAENRDNRSNNQNRDDQKSDETLGSRV